MKRFKRLISKASCTSCTDPTYGEGEGLEGEVFDLKGTLLDPESEENSLRYGHLRVDVPSVSELDEEELEEEEEEEPSVGYYIQAVRSEKSLSLRLGEQHQVLQQLLARRAASTGDSSTQGSPMPQSPFTCFFSPGSTLHAISPATWTSGGSGSGIQPPRLVLGDSSPPTVRCNPLFEGFEATPSPQKPVRQARRSISTPVLLGRVPNAQASTPLQPGSAARAGGTAAAATPPSEPWSRRLPKPSLIQQLEQAHQRELERERQRHRAELAAGLARHKQALADAKAKARGRYERALARAAQHHAQRLAAAQATHRGQLTKLQKAHTAQITQQRASHQQQVAQLRAQLQLACGELRRQRSESLSRPQSPSPSSGSQREGQENRCGTPTSVGKASSPAGVVVPGKQFKLPPVLDLTVATNAPGLLSPNASGLLSPNAPGLLSPPSAAHLTTLPRARSPGLSRLGNGERRQSAASGGGISPLQPRNTWV